MVRQLALTHRDLTLKLNELELKYDKKFKDAYDAIKILLKKDKMISAQNLRRKIGYKT